MLESTQSKQVIKSLHLLLLFFFVDCCSDPVVNNLFHPEVFSSSHLSLILSISSKYSKAVFSAKGIPVSRDISFATFWAYRLGSFFSSEKFS